MHSLSKLLAISLLSIAPSSSVPILINEVKGQTIDYKYELSGQKEYLNNDISNQILQVTPTPKYVVGLRHNLDDHWMILINNKPTLWVQDLPQAVVSVTKLSIIMNAPDFEPDLLKPLVIGNEYVGNYKNTTLFRIPKEDVLNPSLNLTQWINNLRVAADAEPLTLVEAQEQMHQLVTTNEQMDGIASWYGPYFQGRQTASGEQFEQEDFTAAHQSLPFDTYLKVTNLNNGASVVVRINDRGPYVGDRSLDLSHAAAIALNSYDAGVVPVTTTILVASSN
jgi:rare lipoprotein A